MKIMLFFKGVNNKKWLGKIDNIGFNFVSEISFQIPTSLADLFDGNDWSVTSSIR